MYIIAIKGKEKEGAYSVIDQDDDQVLYIFQSQDDATRYALQLEDIDYPKMKVIDIEDDIIIKTSELHGQKYAIITPDDIIVPPDEGMKHDYI